MSRESHTPNQTPNTTPIVRGQALTDRQLRRAIADNAGSNAEVEVGGVRGLFLRVRASGSTSWALRFTVPGKGRRRLSLGSYPAVSLADARAAALSTLGAVAKGEDPTAAPDESTQALADAADEYITGCASRLAAGTVKRYRDDLARFVGWAEQRKVRTLADLDRGTLAKFRDATIASPARAPVRGGKRGDRDAAPATRIGPERVNSILQTIKTFLADARRRGKLEQLDRESIEDTLRPIKVTRERPEFLTPSQIVALLEACLRHDAETFAATRAEHAGETPAGQTPRYTPIAAFALFLLLSGCRRGEALGLTWADVDLDALDHSGERVGEIRLRGAAVKTRRARTIALEVSPALRQLLAAIKLRGDGDPVLGQTVDGVEAARRRLRSTYGAPPFDWQMLRSTCSTYLTCAPAIFGRASHAMAARQLGHSVVVAERHYADLVRGISPEARTLEAAYQCEAVAARVVASVTAPSSTGATVRRLASA